MQSFLTLIWKEFRQQISLAVAIVAVTLFLQFLAFAIAVIDRRPTAGLPWMMSVFWITISYAWGASATLFSRELEEGTADFLRRLPISSRLLLAAKLTWLVGSTLAVGVVLTVISSLWILGTGGDTSSEQIVGVFGVAIFEAMAWGLFFSVRSKSQVHSLLMSGLVAGSVAFFVVMIMTPNGNSPMLDAYANAALPRLAVAGVVFMIAVWNARRWLVTSSRVTVSSITAKNLTPRDEQRLAATPPRGEMRWLVWHAVRQSRTLFRIVSLVLAVIAVAATVAVIYIIRRGEMRDGELSAEMLFQLALLFVAGEFVAIVFSASTFWRDNTSGAAAMLTQHGVAPGKLWWSRIIAFGGFYVAGVLPLLMAVALILAANNKIGIYTFLLCDESPLCSLVLLLSIFFVGQWISLTTRSIINSIILTVASFCGLFFACVAVKVLLGLPAFLWTFVPLWIACLLASRLFVSDWQRGRANWATWWKTRSPIILTVAAIFVAVPFVRVYSIPYVYLGYDLPDQTWESHYTYNSRDVRTDALFHDFLREHPGVRAWRDEAKQRYLGVEKNTQMLRTFSGCSFPATWQEACRNWMIRQISDVTPSMFADIRWGYGGLDWELFCCSPVLVSVASQPTTPPEELREFIEFLETMPQYRAPLALRISSLYQVERYRVARGLDYEGNRQPWWYRWLMPWERYRVLRRLACEFQQQSQAATVWEKAIAEDKVPDATWNKWRTTDCGSGYDLLASEILQDTRRNQLLSRDYIRLYQILEAERKRRMLLIVAALNLWYREHNSLPDDLESLVGVYLKELPTDPLTKLSYKIFPPDASSKDEVGLVPSVAAERKAEKKFPSLNVALPNGERYPSYSNRITLQFVKPAETANGEPAQ
ncbi:MAG: hypothetical protein ACRC46_01595 [Thermoguttaceae bacterium]